MRVEERLCVPRPVSLVRGGTLHCRRTPVWACGKPLQANGRHGTRPLHGHGRYEIVGTTTSTGWWTGPGVVAGGKPTGCMLLKGGT